MIYDPFFITNAQLEQVGVTAEQIEKIFNRSYKTSVWNTKTEDNGIWVRCWVDPSDAPTFTREYAESNN